jgi:uncharacterized protein YkvS
MDKEEELLFNKEGLHFVKVKKNQYKLNFSMENNNIILSKIIDFNLIKLIYDLNGDIYERVNIEKLNENQVIATLLMKNLFEDLGLPQRFTYIHIHRTIEDDKIMFTSKSIKGCRPEGVPKEAEIMAIEDMNITCNIITNHKVTISLNIIFDADFNIPSFVEKIVGVIVGKIFKRVKQFIENVRI